MDVNPFFNEEIKMNIKREKVIINTSIIGVICNILLSVFKGIVGFASSSIAIISDAINNLSDAFSSIITIIGTKIASKSADKEHPYGHGRIEYLTAMIISIIVLYAGVTSFTESIKKIINPVKPHYTYTTLIIVIVAILVKTILGIHVKRVGEQVNSESLVNSGKDALMDSIISMSTLIAALIYILFNISLEAWLGAIISIVIVKSGLEMLKSTLSQILGQRIHKDLSRSIKQTVCSFDGVYGAYDLVLSDYGPDTYLGSIHIEIPDTTVASEIDDLTRKIMKEVYEKHQVILSAIGIYSINTKDEEAIKIREKISTIVYSYKGILQMHGFYYNKEEKKISFDIIIDFADEGKNEIYEKIYSKLKKEYPEYTIEITMDYDISD